MRQILRKILGVTLVRLVEDIRWKTKERCSRFRNWEQLSPESVQHIDDKCMDFWERKTVKEFLELYGKEAKGYINELAIVGSFLISVTEQGLDIQNYHTNVRHDITSILHEWFDGNVNAKEILHWSDFVDEPTEVDLYDYTVDYYRLR